jgi:lathosterol oxidase
MHFLVNYLHRRGGGYQRIQKKIPARKDMRREVIHSLSTILVFAGAYSIIFFPTVLKQTQIYFHVSDRGWPWLILSFPLLIFVHETYFYWMHRFLHRPRVFRAAHRVHHLSMNPTAWTAQSFHPLEAFLEVIWIVPIVFLLPLHWVVLLAFSFFSLTSNIFGHSGIEIYSKESKPSWLNRWMNTSTHHNLHHQNHLGNYGLYFRFWDVWMKTERL